MITPKCVPLLLSVAAAVLGTAGCTSDGYIDGSDGNNTGIIQSRPCKDVAFGVYAPGFAAKYIEPVDTSQATFDIELTLQ
jgi:hypothetical protein